MPTFTYILQFSIHYMPLIIAIYKDTILTIRVQETIACYSKIKIALGSPICFIFLMHSSIDNRAFYNFNYSSSIIDAPVFLVKIYFFSIFYSRGFCCISVSNSNSVITIIIIIGFILRVFTY